MVDLNQYYLISIDQITRNFGNLNFLYLVTIMIVKKILKLNQIIKLLILMQARIFLDMYLMSLCKTNIIANSSFSWWGAWLNNNNDKLILHQKMVK